VRLLIRLEKDSMPFSRPPPGNSHQHLKTKEFIDMKTTLTLISRISSRLIGSTGLRNLPVPSPKVLLLALILGPAMLMVLNSVRYYAA
jgi:hypothetical protein